MSKINVLDFSVANLIAAGEVVDRPASAVKEMLENSLDAGAKNIYVEIKNGGISYIKVSDDGSGIGKEDLPIAIKRHATSKIKEADDLDNILTLGFRGEALAAISSVSKLTIISKSAEEEVGYEMYSEFGRDVTIREIGCNKGTTIIVEDLFSNTPARRKFLKRDVTEGMAVSAVVEKIALSRPDVSISLTIDGSSKIETVGDGKLLNTIYSVLSKDFAKKLLHVKDSNEGIEIEGYIGSPDNVRGNRNYQNFFINGRYIKSNTIASAFEEAYYSFIPTEKYPCGVLNIKINPSLVDVNVHPTKLEVKFSNDKLIFSLVYGAVKNALFENMRRPEIGESTNYSTPTVKTVINPFVPIEERKDKEKEKQINIFEEYASIVAPTIPEYKAITKEESVGNQTTIKVENNPQKERIEYDDENLQMTIPTRNESNEIKLENEVPKTAPEIVQPTIPYYRMVGCLFDAFIIIEMEDKAVVIDKHAAHERIIFEQMRENMRNASIASQMLLIPYDYCATSTELLILEENRETIEKIGISFSTSDGKVTILSYPSVINLDQTVTLLQELSESLSSGDEKANIGKDVAFEKCLFQASCKAAMKAGIKDTEENQKWLCDQLMKYDCVKYCPHGRPVAFDISKSEIEKLFKRT